LIVCTASNAELESFGLPDRPTDPTALKQWQDTYGAIKNIIPVTMQATNKRNSWNLTPNYPGGTWAGGINCDQSQSDTFNPNGYRGVSGTFLVNPLKADSGGLSTTTDWVGIGGYQLTSNVGTIVQCGVENTVVGYLYPWLEVYGATPGSYYSSSPGMNTVYLSSTTGSWVHVGDNLLCQCSVDAADSMMSFLVTDTTNGSSSGIWKLPTAVSGYTTEKCDTSGAEWISEVQVYGLADYGTEYFNNCNYYYGANQAQMQGMVPNPLASLPTCAGVSATAQSTSAATSNNSFYTKWLAAY